MIASWRCFFSLAKEVKYNNYEGLIFSQGAALELFMRRCEV